VGSWNSPTHTWPHELVIECLSWELEREIAGCKSRPFMTERSERIAELLKPAELKPLREITDAAEAHKAIDGQPGWPFSRYHVLEIDLFEPADVAVKRFRNWFAARNTRLIVKEAVSREMLKSKGIAVGPGDGYGVASAPLGLKFQGGVFTTTGHQKPGPKGSGRDLRALAVRRLRNCGSTRPGAAALLKIKAEVLDSGDWSNLFKRAEKLISERIEAHRVIAGAQID